MAEPALTQPGTNAAATQKAGAFAPGAFLNTIIAFLLPYFIAAANDAAEARAEIIETLAAYATRTRAELLQAAQVIALGMTALDVLAEAKTAEMSPNLRIRYRGCANSLNRSVLQTEKALDRRLACEPVATAETIPEPRNDIPDAAVQDAVARARTVVEAHRDRLPGARPVNSAPPTAQQERNKQLWASAMMDTLKQMGLPPQPPSGE